MRRTAGGALRFGPEVHVLDGGTQGLYLLPFLEGTRNLLVFDAVDYGLPPAR
jgi:hydrogenase maturation protease